MQDVWCSLHPTPNTQQRTPHTITLQVEWLLSHSTYLYNLAVFAFPD